MSPVREQYDVTFYPNDDARRIGLYFWRGESPQRAGAATRRGGTQPTSPEQEIGPVPHEEGGRSPTYAAVASWDRFGGGMGMSRSVEGGEPGYGWAEGMDFRDPMGGIPGGELTEVPLPATGWTKAQIRQMIEHGGHLFLIAASNSVLGVPSGSAAAAIVVANGSAGTTNWSAAVFNDNLYIGAVGPSAALIRRNLAGTWTVHATVPRVALATVWWEIAGVGAHRLIASNIHPTDGNQGYHIQYVAADPTNAGDWSAQIQVGDSGYRILSLTGSPRVIWAVKQDGIHAISNSLRQANLTPYWREMFWSNNGVASTWFDGHVYATTRQGLDRVDGTSGTLQDIPEWCDLRWHPNRTPVGGPPTAMCVEFGWLAAAFQGWNEGQLSAYLCYGKDRVRAGIGGPGPLLWHGATVILPNQVVRSLKVMHVNDLPRLWIATEDAVTGEQHLYWQSLPQDGSPLQDLRRSGNHRFLTTGRAYLTGEAFGDYGAMKTIHHYDGVGEGLDPTSYFDVYASSDNGAYAQQGAMKRRRTTFVPASTQMRGNEWTVALIAVGTRTAPPVLRSLKARATVSNEQPQQRTFRVASGPVSGQLHGHGTDRRNPGTTWRLLDRLQNAGPIEYRDELGQTMTVSVDSVTHSPVENADGSGYSRISTVVLTVLLEIAKYNDKATYGSGYKYG